MTKSSKPKSKPKKMLSQWDIVRALPMIDMLERERRMLEWVGIHGRARRWVALTGSTVAQSLALRMNVNVRTAQYALTSLRKKDWLAFSDDLHGRQAVYLTDELDAVAKTALVRYRVRSVIGEKGWVELKGTDKLADWIWAKATERLEPEPKEKAPAWATRQEREVWDAYDQLRDLSRKLVRIKIMHVARDLHNEQKARAEAPRPRRAAKPTRPPLQMVRSDAKPA